MKSGRIQQQQQQQQYHASQFQESWRDLENGVHATDAAGAGAEAEVVVAKGEGGEGTKGKKSVFRLYPPIKDGEVKRLYWKRGIVAVGFAMVVVVVVAVVVGVGVYGRR